MDALLPGLKGLLNYHPVLVHFPIALWIAALLFELLALLRASDELHRVAVAVLYLATLLAIPTMLSGWQAEEAVPQAGAAHSVKEVHETLMVTASGISFALSALAFFFLQKKPTAALRWMFLAGLVILAGVLTLGADRGAMLVYHYGTSVDWSSAQRQK